MLFNSGAFLFGYLPLVLLGFFLLARLDRRWALGWLLLASLVFYGWWNPRDVPLLLLSIGFNLVCARWLTAQCTLPAQGAARWWTANRVLAFAVITNLAMLAYFKYLGFAVEAAAELLGQPWQAPATVLPLGISFFTFTQIAFLVDLRAGRVSDLDPMRYGVFVTYFPHLIAGPILHHAEMMPQFARADVFRFSPDRLADGGAIFTIGLFKKVVLADQFGRYARPAFDAASTHALTSFESWGAALSYTLQLYFDFSGYSDMAIGLAVMIGVRLPLNFHSPYKARNIADFWRRWHITLSRFLRDYLYIPLGGNRRGPRRRYVNLLVTMVLGGLWHGAGWTFVLWGALHGAYLVVHGLWRQLLLRLASRGVVARLPGAGALSWLLTFTAVVVAWVFFRAADLPTALSMLRAMSGQNGSVLPDQLIQALPALAHVATGAGKVPFLGDGTVMGAVEMALMLALGMAIVLLAPASNELRTRSLYLLIVPCGALALQQVLFGRSSEFLYFQF